MLRVREREAGQHLLALLRPAVAVRVLQVPDVGGCGDEHALPVAHHPRGKHEAVGEHACSRSERPSPSRSSSSRIRPVGRGVERVARHLGDEHAAVLVEVQRHRRGHLRLGGDQLDRVALLDAEGPQRLAGAQRRTRLPSTGRGQRGEGQDEAEPQRPGHDRAAGAGWKPQRSSNAASSCGVASSFERGGQQILREHRVAILALVIDEPGHVEGLDGFVDPAEKRLPVVARGRPDAASAHARRAGAKRASA